MDNEFGTKKSFVTIKNLVVLLVVVIVVIAGAVYWAKFRQVEKTSDIDPKFNYNEYNISGLPEKIDEEMIIGAGSTIIKMFSTEEKAGVKEITVKYQSTDNIESLTNQFQNYFKEKKWHKQNEYISDEVVTLSYWNDLDNLNVLLVSSTNSTTVDLTYTDYPTYAEINTSPEKIEKYKQVLIVYRTDYEGEISKYLSEDLPVKNITKILESLDLIYLGIFENTSIYISSDSVEKTVDNFTKYFKEEELFYDFFDTEDGAIMVADLGVDRSLNITVQKEGNGSKVEIKNIEPLESIPANN